MKTVHRLFILLFFRQTIAGIVRKPPAFSTPTFSNSYLPAAMQVIFHAVEQLKRLQIEEMQQNNSSISSTSPHPPGQYQPSVIISTTLQPMIELTEMTSFNAENNEEKPEVNQEVAAVSEEEPEVNEEKTEGNYATPEVDREVPENNQNIGEPNGGLPEVHRVGDGDNRTNPNKDESSTMQNEAGKFEIHHVIGSTLAFNDVSSTTISISEGSKEKPSIDSVIGDIYDIVKPSSPSFLESKIFLEDSVREEECLEEKDDDTRFTLLGERVVQVPRPSLSNYLRRTNMPPKASLHQLAALYDALSKDARRQGFAKYSGYSENILKTLETSAGGGIGPQLKELLEYTIKKNELTREDSKTKTKATLQELEELGSTLNTDLRRLLPLRYIP